MFLVQKKKKQNNNVFFFWYKKENQYWIRDTLLKLNKKELIPKFIKTSTFLPQQHTDITSKRNKKRKK